MSEDLNQCDMCGGMCRKPYTRCLKCKNPQTAEQPKKKDDYSKGARTGLAHNLTTQFLLGVTSNEEAQQSRIDYFWTKYDSVFEAFKKKIEEKEG